ncbi:MAG TPA: ClpXP protease specificity-enhancing factor [Gammaproteobacteria bacterium]|nr:ClpXP protease specificity-enhancing factor [Gammaproteobacteria bacterium]
MLSSRPYMIRAIHDWITDSGMTPYLLVDADVEGVEVPRQYVDSGKIILNISPQACGNLVLGNEQVRFNARFAGKPMAVVVPVRAVLAIYARENGQGMMFDEGGDGGDGDDTPPRQGSTRPHLKVIK